MTSNTSRRAVLASVASLPALAIIPATALAAEPDIEQLWRKRMAVLAQIEENSAAYSKAADTLPAWARPGLDQIAKDGSYCGIEVGWPEVENPTLPDYDNVVTLVRPNLNEIRHRYESNPFKGRADVRASYRARARQFVARVREQRRLRNAAGLTTLGKRCDKLCTSLYEIEETIQQACLPGAYIVLAAMMIIEISYDGDAGAKVPVSVLQPLLPVLPQYLAFAAQKEIRRYAEQEVDDKDEATAAQS
jgi:hypothetical protein